jgi:hypothetical protein
LSSTLALSTSILADSLSVELSEFLSITYYSCSLFFSFSISFSLSFKNSYSCLYFSNFSCNCSDRSCSFLVSLRTPVISLCTYRISSFFYLMSSLIACKALSLYYMPNKAFCQSSSKVFLLLTILSISMAASFRVLRAAAVSSFCEIN